MVRLRERDNDFALISIDWANDSVTGPLIGDALAEANAWRWVFYRSLSIVTVGFASIIVFFKLENRKLSLIQKFLEI